MGTGSPPESGALPLEGVDRPTRILALVTGLTLAVYPVLTLLLEVTGVASGPRLHDFAAYYNGATRVLEGYPLYVPTEDIPSLTAQLSPEKEYLYPPITVILFFPLALFPPVVAGVIWTLLSVTVLVWSVLRLVSALDIDLSPGQQTLVGWLVVGYAPTITGIKSGQISILLTALLCFALAEYEGTQDTDRPRGRGRHLVSGAMTTLASVPKPFYATSGAHLLRSRRRFLGAVLTGVGLAATSLLVFNLETHLAYVDILRRGGSLSGVTRPPATWNAGQFRPLYLLGQRAMVVSVAVVLGTILLALASLRDDAHRTGRYVFLLGIVTMLFVVGTVNTPELHVLVPVFIALVVTEVRRADGQTAAVLLALFLVHLHPYTVEFIAKFGPRYLPPVERLIPALPALQPALWGLLILYGLLVWRLTSRLRRVWTGSVDT